MQERARLSTIIAFALFVVLVGQACRTNQVPEAQAKDAEITAKIKAQLAQDIRLATLTNVDVNTTNLKVTLSGTVSSDAEKDAIQKVAVSIAEVRGVNNNLQVARTSSP